MTDPAASPAVAGWYPDPAGSAQRRWWDGTKWTDTLETPYSAAASAQVKTASSMCICGLALSGRVRGAVSSNPATG